jgi:Na+-driven multidrug efflux pump
LISIRLGEGKKDEAEEILFLALKYIVIAMILFAGFYIVFEDAILGMLSISEATIPYAKSYIEILIIGAIIGIPGYCLNNSLRAIGKARISMNIILFTSVLNIILDPIFIFVLDMGIAGAAIATVISQTVLTVYVIYMFVKGKDYEKWFAFFFRSSTCESCKYIHQLEFPELWNRFRYCICDNNVYCI